METAQELIKQLKETKEKKDIKFTTIHEHLRIPGTDTYRVSMTTLRRVFSNGSESHASSYNYEETLIPIKNAMREIEGLPKESSSDIEALKAIISVQNEELDRILEIKDHLDSRVNYLIEQGNLKDSWIKEKDDMIKRVMDRNDKKDQAIHDLMEEIKKLEEAYRELLSRCKHCNRSKTKNGTESEI